MSQPKAFSDLVQEQKSKKEPEAKKAEPAPQMVYKAKVKAPEEAKVQPVSMTLGT